MCVVCRGMVGRGDGQTREDLASFRQTVGNKAIDDLAGARYRELRGPNVRGDVRGGRWGNGLGDRQSKVVPSSAESRGWRMTRNAPTAKSSLPCIALDKHTRLSSFSRQQWQRQSLFQRGNSCTTTYLFFDESRDRSLRCCLLDAMHSSSPGGETLLVEVTADRQS